MKTNPKYKLSPTKSYPYRPILHDLKAKTLFYRICFDHDIPLDIKVPPPCSRDVTQLTSFSLHTKKQNKTYQKFHFKVSFLITTSHTFGFCITFWSSVAVVLHCVHIVPFKGSATCCVRCTRCWYWSPPLADIWQLFSLASGIFLKNLIFMYHKT